MASARPTDRRLLERIERLAAATVGQRDDTLHQSLERADGWLIALIEAGAGERLLRVEAYARFFEAAGGPRVVRQIGPPAAPATIAAAERALGFALPATLRELVADRGQLAFMDRQRVAGREVCPATFAVDQLPAAHHRFERRVAPLLAGYAARYDQLRDVYRAADPDWRAWRPGSQGGVFAPEAIEEARLLPIYPYYDEGAHLMAIHLGDADDAPIFVGGGGDEPYHFLAMGHGLQRWTSLMVDRVIEAVTSTLAEILG